MSPSLPDPDHSAGSLETLFAFYELVPGAEEFDLVDELPYAPADVLTEGQVFALLEHRLGARVVERRRHDLR